MTQQYKKTLSFRGRVHIWMRVLRLVFFGQPGNRVNYRQFMFIVPSFLIILLSFFAWHFFPLGVTNVYASVIETQEQMNRQKEEAILHVQRIIREGKDKRAYVAKKYNTPIESLEDVPYRTDVVHSWETDIQTYGVVEHDLPGVPGVAFLRFSDGSHLHIFEYRPPECAGEKLLEGATKGCSYTQGMTTSSLAYRKLFDSTHNLGDLYSFLTTHDLERHTSLYIDAETFTQRKPKLEGGFYRFDTIVSGGQVRIEHFIDETSLVPAKDRVILIEDGIEYEMAVIEYTRMEWISKEAFSSYFNPEMYPYARTALVPLE